MPTVRETLTGQALNLLADDDDVVDYFTRTANRATLNKSTFRREMLSNNPVDFPRLLIDFARGSHSMYTQAEATDGFAADDVNFHTSGVYFPVDRVFTLQITVREAQPKAGVVNAPEEVILAALFKAGPRFGLPSLVYRIGEARYDRRETRADEKPVAGFVTTIQLPITTQESGLTLLT